MPDLFEPVRLGAIELANRIVMAPMTRSRAGEDDLATALMVDYYRQRASAGMIVTEGTHPSADGKGYCRTPGLFDTAQASAWRAVTSAVHSSGGRIVVQLMHVGRIASRLNKAPDAETIAPSAIRARGRMFTDAAGMVELETPRALALEEIPAVVAEFATAGRLAREAGFDGVELHCSSGYLPMQFLSTGTNQRTDRYGGPVANRVRFVIEVLAALAGATSADRVGFRIAPGNPFNDVTDDDPAATYGALLDQANELGLAYLHLVDVRPPGLDVRGLARRHWRGPLILNESIDGAQARALVGSGAADAFAFGRSFIANPDFVERLRSDLPLADFDPKTLYSTGPRGYTDYAPFAGTPGQDAA